MEKEFYTTKEFAVLINATFRHVLSMIKHNKIRAVNISIGERPVYRILKSEYLRFIAEQLEEKK